MTLSRRNLLGFAAAGAVLPGMGLLPRVLHAATPTVLDRYFVFAYFSGGWDMLLGLDPRHPGDFPSETAAVTGIEPAYERQSALTEADWMVETDVEGMVFGPWIGGLSRHASRIALLRGMAMDSVAHTAARRHALTGILPAGTTVRGSSVSTWLASMLGENEPIPNLVAGVSSFNIGHPLWASGLPAQNIDDLYEALSPSDRALLAPQRDALETFFARQAERATTQRARDVYGNRIIARNLIDLELAEFFNLDSDDPDMVRLRERFGVDSGETGDSGPMGILAAQALTRGISRCVTLTISDGLDSHQGAAWENDHGPRLQRGFDTIAALADHLDETPFGDGSSWLDHTTIVCFSEFARTTRLNGNGGRDHNLVNAMLTLGGGIRGGQVLGATTDAGMLAQPVDLTTGALSGAGELITNNHVARSLLHGIGVTEDVADFRAPPVAALLEEA